MKNLTLLIVWFVSTSATAGQKCLEPGSKLRADVVVSSKKGLNLVVQNAKEIQEYYRRQLGVTIESLATVTDPETRKFIYELDGDVHMFMGYAPDSGIGNVWSMAMAFNPGGLNNPRSQANLTITDQQGERFFYRLECESSPDLE